MIYLGSSVFKIARLLFIAMFSVHLFACIFFRVKVASASTPEDVATFYTSKNVAEDVGTYCQALRSYFFLFLGVNRRVIVRKVGNIRVLI